ncbi:MAG: hypothetical protein AB7F93_07550 [Immundisolibacter sp.]|uniref:hypothetical protein n=1 Tax=Immundisolibacter sp. TaxID=1934948 RepID=UPI003D0F44BF
MSTTLLLKRDGETIAIATPHWADSLALALRYGWNPLGPTAAYLASGFKVSLADASALAAAFDRIFESALQDPMRFHPVRVDLSELSLVNDFVREGAFEVWDA